MINNDIYEKEIDIRKKILGIDKRKTRIRTLINGHYVELYGVGTEPTDIDFIGKVIVPKARAFEEIYKAEAYAVIYSNFGEIGKHLTILFVSNYRYEWGDNRKWLEKMQPIGYVYNLTYPEYSEFGTVFLKCQDGEVERILKKWARL